MLSAIIDIVRATRRMGAKYLKFKAINNETIMAATSNIINLSIISNE